MAAPSPPSLPWRGCRRIVSATLSPFGSEQASTTERARLATVAARIGRQLGASCGPSTAMPSLSALTAKTRSPSGVTASPRGSSSARAARQSADAADAQAASRADGRDEGAGRGVELERDDGVGARGCDPDDVGVGADRERAGAVQERREDAAGGRRETRDAGREAERARGGVAVEREHRGVVDGRRDHGRAVGRDGDGGARASPSTTPQSASATSLRQPEPGDICVSVPVSGLRWNEVSVPALEVT